MNQPKIFYLKDKHDHRVACVASHINGDHIEYAVSTHNPRDVFNREVARQVAVGRLANPHKHNGTVLTIEKAGNIKARLLWDLLKHTDLPTRTRDAARQWIKQASKKTAENLSKAA